MSSRSLFAGNALRASYDRRCEDRTKKIRPRCLGANLGRHASHDVRLARPPGAKISWLVARTLRNQIVRASAADRDTLPGALNSDLGPSQKDPAENVGRILAALLRMGGLRDLRIDLPFYGGRGEAPALFAGAMR